MSELKIMPCHSRTRHVNRNSDGVCLNVVLLQGEVVTQCVLKLPLDTLLSQSSLKLERGRFEEAVKKLCEIQFASSGLYLICILLSFSHD